MADVAVLIPTRDRPDSLAKALESVAAQTRCPDFVVVISDCDSTFENGTNRVIRNFTEKFAKIECIRNRRTKNLSGAVNTGLAHLIELGVFPESTFIALLDDDDEWESDYLEQCLESADLGSYDLVVSGLIRHESKTDRGTALSIPTSLSTHDFFIGNPHIQGSNLFVRFSTMLQAGGFDEALESTTDRDICIRLLDLGTVKVGFVPAHLVHHWALPTQERLSTPGSERKQNGLRAFYWKYAPQMSLPEREAFRKRAYDLFGCTVEDPLFAECTCEEETDHQQCIPTEGVKFPIVVGFMATRMDSTENLLDDLVTLFGTSDVGRAVVIYDNTRSTAQLQGLIEHPKYASLNCMMIDAGTIERESERGTYGNYLVEPDNRNGIAPGRTVLHHILYRESKKFPGSVVWVLDDDIRFETVEKDGMVVKITLVEVQRAILHMKERGISIANGQVTGDAPIPAHSMLRTQLVDLLSHLKMYEAGSSVIGKQSDFLPIIASKYPDYYYDYSDLHTAHLEIPFWTGIDCDKLLRRIADIRSGINLFRQVVATEPESRLNEDATRTIPQRGGNTMVLNPECLRMFPNISPRINATNVRRGDTFWCILNGRIKGQIVDRFPVALRQERTHEAGSNFNLDTLRSDMYGNAFVRSMDAYYLRKIGETGELPRRIRLAISDEDIDAIVDAFRKILERRLLRFVENGYRIWGLCNAIDATLSASRFQQQDETKAALRFIRELKEVYSPQEIWRFYEITKLFQEDDLKTFLRNFHDSITSYRSCLSPDMLPESVEHARGMIASILKKRNEAKPQELKYLGHGHEGAVFTDGIRAYKYFFAGKANFQDGRLDLLRDHLLNNPELQHICRLLEIVEDTGELVFVMEYAEGSEYRGNHLKDILALLDECRCAGIAFTNLHPKNLIITKDGLKLIDLGDSFVPCNEREYLQMCRRAYLTYRWHFRDDVSELMSQALFDPKLPELAGFEYFFSATQNKHKSALLDERIISIAAEGGPSPVLDYGCGYGAIAEPLVKRGFDVTGYDIDASVLVKNLAKHHSARYIGRNDLAFLKETGERFSKVICSLVLCTIEDDNEVTDVVADMRALVTDDGEAIVAFCNPFYTFTEESETHIKIDLPEEHRYHDKFIFRKQMKETGKIRTEVHRPFSFYKHLFHRCGFDITNIEEIRSTDIQRLCPSSDYLICRLKPLKIPDKKSVSLLIRAGAMEWQTIDFQIRHIIRQLQGPQSFVETLVVTDTHNGPFSRQYTEVNQKEFREKLDAWMREGVIDRVIVAPDEPPLIEETFQKWFGVGSRLPRCENGQPTFMSLYGIEQCVGDYVLQLDSDCLICRLDRDHDYLGDMISVFEQDPDALTVSFNIAHEEDHPYNANNSGVKWRTEVRCSLIDKRRVEDALPMSNGINSESILTLPWHRSMDLLLKSGKKQSFRGGDHRTFFIHVPNDRKTDPNEWYTIMHRVEAGQIPHMQYGNVDLKGSLQDWTGSMNQEYVFVVRGQNVPIPKLRRCADSLARQRSRNFSIVFVDACSSNAMAEYIREVLLDEWGGNATYFGNLMAITPLENHDIAIRRICSNPESVIITLDADDALIGEDVIKHLDGIYRKGADLSVGSMLRTDKFVRYAVTFSSPRSARGGNVWQHLRSFKKYLYDAIPEDYLQINSEWIPYAEDWAFMVPMVEMANKPMHIAEPLYFYEPTGGKNEQMRAIREDLIHKIMSKPPLLPNMHQKGM
ncbi:MAG: hypothetical protein APR53_06230 [Methanoculleus sp. SDB]|nr:MAG: hypothetical protein APR53_06230 [Methanoculleus sp. SDB]